MKEKYLRLNPMKFYYLCIEWENNMMNWNYFLNFIIGDMNPYVAYSTSLRGLMNLQWKELNTLNSSNDFDNNLIHFSLSAWDNMIERYIWLLQPYYEDKLYQAFLSVGISNETILHWISTNTYNGNYDTKHRIGGNTFRLSDVFRNKGIEECVKIALEIISSPIEYDNQSYLSSSLNNSSFQYFPDSPTHHNISPYKNFNSKQYTITEVSLPSQYSSPFINQQENFVNNDNNLKYSPSLLSKKISPILPRPYSARNQEIKSSSIESFPDIPSSRSKRDYYKSYTNPSDESYQKNDYNYYSPQKEGRKKYNKNDDYNQSSRVKVLRKGYYSNSNSNSNSYYDKPREERKVYSSAGGESSRKYSNNRIEQNYNSFERKSPKEVRVQDNLFIENHESKNPNLKIKNRRQTGVNQHVNSNNNGRNNNKEKSQKVNQNFSYSDISYPNDNDVSYEKEKEFNQYSNSKMKQNKIITSNNKILKNNVDNNVDNDENENEGEFSDGRDIEEGDIMI